LLRHCVSDTVTNEWRHRIGHAVAKQIFALSSESHSVS
jgi:hypothetical protein